MPGGDQKYTIQPNSDGSANISQPENDLAAFWNHLKLKKRDYKVALKNYRAKRAKQHWLKTPATSDEEKN